MPLRLHLVGDEKYLVFPRVFGWREGGECKDEKIFYLVEKKNKMKKIVLV